MRYEGAIYRPPSEAGSLILQVTIGCSHNRCIFCVSFLTKKFRERKMDEILEDIEFAFTVQGGQAGFLADGDAGNGYCKRLTILDAFTVLS